MERDSRIISQESFSEDLDGNNQTEVYFNEAGRQACEIAEESTQVTIGTQEISPQADDVVRSNFGEYRRQAHHDKLNREQEQNLAKRIATGKVAQKYLSQDDLTESESQRMAAIAEDGKAAREKFAVHNLRLAMGLAKSYNQVNDKLDRLDLISEANIGLMEAVDSFDHTKGYRFSNHAYTKIKKALQRAIHRSAKTIRAPQHVWERQSQIRRAREKLARELEREPTDKEVATRTGLSLEKVCETDRAFLAIESLDRMVGEDEQDSPSLASFVASEEAELQELESRLVLENLKRDLEFTIEQLETTELLDKEELTAIVHYFGLKGEEKKTLVEIGEIIGYSKKTAAKRRDSGLEKLRKHAGDQLYAHFAALAA